MKTVILGRTGIVVPSLGFGALPIQRTDRDTACRLVRKAFDHGVRFFDTARMYSDSEEKLGSALGDVRHEVIIATKTTATDRATARAHLETSLSALRTNYLDVVQLHNPERLPSPDDENSAYAALLEARQQGIVRFIGLTSHSRQLAREGVLSGLFDTLQYPLSYLSTPEELELIELCRDRNLGVIAMKALCGGLLRSVPVAYAFLDRFSNLVPIWGIQRERELDEFIALAESPPTYSAEFAAIVEEERRQLAGSFCRGCGYCLPCPADIPIHWAARMSLLLRRAPTAQFLTPDWQAKMARIADCTNCGACASRCPYGLETPALLAKVLEDYRTFL